MTASGTYNYNPSLGELVLYAFNLCGIRNTAITQQHMESARMAANLLLGRWSSEGVNLWMVTLQSIPLVQGQSTYSVPSNNIVMLDAYVTTGSTVFTGYINGTTLTVTNNVYLSSGTVISGQSITNGTTITSVNNASFTGSITAGVLTVSSTNSGSVAVGMAITGNSIPSGTYIVSTSGGNWVLNNSITVSSEAISGVSYNLNNSQTVAISQMIGETAQSIDRLILPISRTEYASYPNKDQQGFPTTYWQDRLINGTVTLWPVPDGTQSSFSYYQVGQIDDANFTNGQTVNMPGYFLEAFAYGLAQRLASIWSPDKMALLKPLADEAYQIAVQQNVETAQYYISPMVSGYYR